MEDEYHDIMAPLAQWCPGVTTIQPLPETLRMVIGRLEDVTERLRDLLVRAETEVP